MRAECRMGQRLFTTEEDELIRQHYPGAGARACRAYLPSRANSSIETRAHKLGLSGIRGPLSDEGQASRRTKLRLARERRMANPDRAQRPCLGPCGQMFTSEWIGHRMCDSCRQRAARIGMDRSVSAGGRV